MIIRRGEVYFVDLEPTVGREQQGRRPVVVVSNDYLNSQPLVIVVVPGTRTQRADPVYPWNVPIPAGEAGLRKDTTFLTFQVRALDPSRFTEQSVGALNADSLGILDQALAWSLGLTPGAAV